MVAVDLPDLKILRSLHANGRMANAELARRCDLPPSTCLERVRRLEERGVIRGYRAVIDARELGLEIQALVAVSLARHQAVPIEGFEDAIRAVPEVRACYHVTGRYDYLIHVVVRDIDHLRELVTKGLAAIPGVQREETFLVLSTPKEDEGFPLAGAAEDPPEKTGPENRRPSGRTAPREGTDPAGGEPAAPEET